MDDLLDQCEGLTDEDRLQMEAVKAGIFLSADMSRADVLLCCKLAIERALVVCHAAPMSTASLYRDDMSGSVVDGDEQPLVVRVLNGGRGGRLERSVRDSRAPVIQDVYPITNRHGVVIGALATEYNMFAYERHRGRSRVYQDAIRTVMRMCARGELASAKELSRFGLYDGIYQVDRNRMIPYMSGVAANLFRSAGITVDVEGQPLADLEAMDVEIANTVFALGECLERLEETPDGRVWIRKGIPLRESPDAPGLTGLRISWQTLFRQREKGDVDYVLVLLHNATEAVQKQRELNVKSAIIQEVHHRVKNNLQSVAAILRIQARRAVHEETRQQLTEAVNRILSVAVIHEFLGEGDERLINIRDLADRVAGQIGQVTSNPDQEIELHVEGPRIRLPAGQATPVAMVINELTLNALEHGLQGFQKGRIDVTLEDLGQYVRVTVKNSGRGLPPDFDPKQSGSLGLQIVQTLVSDDLKGELSFESLTPDAAEEALDEDADVLSSGARAVVTFPKRSLKVD